MNTKTLQIATPNDTTIVLTRTFAAPRRLVWEAMFTAEKLRRWLLPPPGWTTSICEVDARVGGALRLASRSPEADPAMQLLGVFTEVVPHERIAHTETMVTGAGEPVGTLVETHEFAERGGVTAMRITQVYASKAARDDALASGMGECMEPGYRQLDALLASPA